MMKKFMMGAAAFCCMAISTVALTACGSDSSDSGSGGDTNVYKGAVIEVSYKEPQDILEVCDVTVTINGASEAVTSSDWKKTVKADALPAHFSVQLNTAKKESKDWNPEKTYSVFLKEPLTLIIYAINAKGDKVIIHESDVSHNSPTDVKGVEQMDIALKRFGTYSGGFEISKYGEVTASWITPYEDL